MTNWLRPSDIEYLVRRHLADIRAFAERGQPHWWLRPGMYTAVLGVSLALAVNELIQNALEHGFDNVAHGTVNIVLSENKSDYQIRVEDDGAGLAKNFQTSDSLGLRIVQGMIVEDLRGEFKITNRRGKRGTVATLTIPKMKITG